MSSGLPLDAEDHGVRDAFWAGKRCARTRQIFRCWNVIRYLCHSLDIGGIAEGQPLENPVAMIYKICCARSLAIATCPVENGNRKKVETKRYQVPPTENHALPALIRRGQLRREARGKADPSPCDCSRSSKKLQRVLQILGPNHYLHVQGFGDGKLWVDWQAGMDVSRGNEGFRGWVG